MILFNQIKFLQATKITNFTKLDFCSDDDFKKQSKLKLTDDNAQ
jgi:hypothetical protein